MLRQIFQEELILIKQMYQKGVTQWYKFQPYPCNGCNALMQKAMNFNDVAFVSVKKSN